MNGKIKSTVYCGLAAAFLSVASLITIPLPSGVPITLQTFATALTGYLLGARLGGLTVAVYIAVGAVGVPVFSGMRGGLQVLFGATGGYIFGFAAMAVLCGAFARRGRGFAVVGGMLGLLVCHLLGAAYFGFVTGRGLIESLAVASLPYLVKDVISVVAAELLAERLRRLI